MNADVVVIGAGAIGSSIALELARAGWHVVVVDKAPAAGEGSTSASSAVVRFNFSTWDGVAAAWEARHCWQDWRAHLDMNGDGALASYRRTGLAMLDTELAPRSLFVPLFDRAGVAYEQWDAATLAARVPGIDTGRYGPPARLDEDRFWSDADGHLGAVFTPDAGYVDDARLAAQNLAAAAQHHGAIFRFAHTVTDIPRQHDRVCGVALASGEHIGAAVVVNAAGPWSSALNRLAGVGADFTVGLRPLRQEVHHVPFPAGDAAESTVAIADLDLGIYTRGDAGGGMLIGGTEPACDPLHWLETPEDAGLHPTSAIFAAQVTRAARRFPGLGVPARPRGVVGVYDVSDDWTPIYDRTELPGFYLAAGTSGNQFKNAPVAGKFLAAIIEQTENGVDHDERPVRFVGEHTGCEIDLAAFSRTRRFNAGTSGTVLG